MKTKKKLTPEQRQQILDMYHAMPADAKTRYADIATVIGCSISAAFTVVKKALKPEPKEKLFNHKIFPF